MRLDVIRVPSRQTRRSRVDTDDLNEQCSVVSMNLIRSYNFSSASPIESKTSWILRRKMIYLIEANKFSKIAVKARCLYLSTRYLKDSHSAQLHPDQRASSNSRSDETDTQSTNIGRDLSPISFTADRFPITTTHRKKLCMVNRKSKRINDRRREISESK
jgi:hypothetical protein